MSLFYSYWMSLNHIATRKSFGKFVSQSAMNGCAVIELTWTDKVRKLLLTYWLHASTSSFLLWQWRPNFLNGCPVIYISDSTMLMQEIVISFEEVTQTKLKVKLQFSIFYAIFKYCKRLAFQAKVFFSNSWFIARFRSLRNLFLMFYF